MLEKKTTKLYTKCSAIVHNTLMSLEPKRNIPSANKKHSVVPFSQERRSPALISNGTIVVVKKQNEIMEIDDFDFSVPPFQQA